MIYERVNDSNQLPGTEYMHIEVHILCKKFNRYHFRIIFLLLFILQSLIPLKEEWDVKTSEERKTSESYRLASEECKELIDVSGTFYCNLRKFRVNIVVSLGKHGIQDYKHFFKILDTQMKCNLVEINFLFESVTRSQYFTYQDSKVSVQNLQICGKVCDE